MEEKESQFIVKVDMETSEVSLQVENMTEVQVVAVMVELLQKMVTLPDSVIHASFDNYESYQAFMEQERKK